MGMFVVQGELKRVDVGWHLANVAPSFLRLNIRAFMLFTVWVPCGSIQ